MKRWLITLALLTTSCRSGTRSTHVMQVRERTGTMIPSLGGPLPFVTTPCYSGEYTQTFSEWRSRVK